MFFFRHYACLSQKSSCLKGSLYQIRFSLGMFKRVKPLLLFLIIRYCQLSSLTPLHSLERPSRKETSPQQTTKQRLQNSEPCASQLLACRLPGGSVSVSFMRNSHCMNRPQRFNAVVSWRVSRSCQQLHDFVDAESYFDIIPYREGKRCTRAHLGFPKDSILMLNEKAV